MRAGNDREARLYIMGKRNKAAQEKVEVSQEEQGEVEVKDTTADSETYSFRPIEVEDMLGGIRYRIRQLNALTRSAFNPNSPADHDLLMALLLQNFMFLERDLYVAGEVAKKGQEFDFIQSDVLDLLEGIEGFEEIESAEDAEDVKDKEVNG
jgi:hypothetical protein